MPVIRLTIEYEGTAYVGWQDQPNGPTVQVALEEAIARLTGERLRVIGASRTDSGVHARGQVLHFQTQSTIAPDRFAPALNSHLPPDIAVVESAAVADDFHARYHAQWKWYRYRILNSRAPSPLRRRVTWRHAGPLGIDAMREAAGWFTGEKDFRAFCAEPDLKESTVRTLYVSEVAASGDEVVYDCAGSGFLYTMVRTLVGSLVQVGAGNLTVDDLRRAHAAGQRSIHCPTAPALGLCLMHVGYDAFTPAVFEGLRKALP